MEEFLNNARLAHLIEIMSAEGVTLQDLVEASDEELSLLTTKVGDRIRLRSAVAKIRNDGSSSNKVTELIVTDPNGFLTTPDRDPVALPVRQNAVIFNNSQPQQDINSSVLLIEEELLGQKDQDFSFPLDFFDINEPDKADALKNLLLKQTTGRTLIEKSKKGEALTPRDRSYLVSLIVEYELQSLKKINQTIRKDIWQKWANEIPVLFKGENKNLYYVPFHVVDGKVIQASGLIHNRLITHRRSLTPECKKRKLGSESGDSNDSGCSSKSSNPSVETSKRVRPLPDGLNVSDQENAKIALDWLQGSSSPYDMLISKWRDTFDLRNNIIKECTYVEYFHKFAALKLPNGYELLTTDFEVVYPKANREFEENFPIIKQKLLKLLAERAESNKVEQSTLDLLELASVGEEQTNVAALLGIVTLLRQMPVIAVPKKKVWRLSRDEARNGFLPRVATASEIGTYCIQRDMLYLEKGIPNQPFILAVGPSWEQIQQYEIVITAEIRYQVPTICAAIKHIYNMYWALDCAYPKVATPCWMLIQLAIFKMTSKYDVEGVPLRELMSRLNALN